MSNHDSEAENNLVELIQAAEAGNAAAQSHLGWCYDEGVSVEVDHEKCFIYSIIRINNLKAAMKSIRFYKTGWSFQRYSFICVI